jgi:hypothetical protein
MQQVRNMMISTSEIPNTSPRFPVRIYREEEEVHDALHLRTNQTPAKIASSDSDPQPTGIITPHV